MMVSPLLSKIFRRQKIYTESNLSLKTINATAKDCNINFNTPRIFKNEFLSYSASYLDHAGNAMCDSQLRFNDCVQTDTCLLIRADISINSSNYVPVYKQIWPISQGILMDFPTSLSIIELKLRSIPLSTHYYKKIYASPYCRNTFTESYPTRRAIVDLDEIVPVLEEALPSNINNRQISRARYASEGDVLILDPLLLEIIPRRRIKTPLSESEQNKIARISITYILAFFALVLTTYFVIYLA